MITVAAPLLNEPTASMVTADESNVVKQSAQRPRNPVQIDGFRHDAGVAQLAAGSPAHETAELIVQAALALGGLALQPAE
jgi:hypothetical protein